MATNYYGSKRQIVNSRLPNEAVVYGPFPLLLSSGAVLDEGVYIVWDGCELSCVNKTQLIYQSSIAVIQENIVLPACRLTQDQLDLLVCGVGYDRASEEDRNKLVLAGELNRPVNAFYRPLTSDRTLILNATSGLAIERDYFCARRAGMTFYKRAYSPDATMLEFDYSHEKDSALSRFIRFSLAMYISLKHQMPFKVRATATDRSPMYDRFLFAVAYDEAEQYCNEMLDVLKQFRPAMVRLFTQHTKIDQVASQQPFEFDPDDRVARGYPSPHFQGPNHTFDTLLINKLARLFRLNVDQSLINKQSPRFFGEQPVRGNSSPASAAPLKRNI